VVNSIAAILGGSSLPPEDTTDPDAPVIRLTGFAMFGGVSVQRRAADGGTAAKLDHRGLHHEQRRIHREFRDKQREVHREFRDQQRELRRRRRD
jgi:hypothetical protein